MFSTVALLFAISLITSTISTIIRDFHMFLNSTLRMLLYLSGVLWPITILSDFPIIMKIMQLNPLYYLIEGDRKSTRLNSSHVAISYAVFCLKKKNKYHAS